MQPLAERLRPKNINEYVGQEHLVGENAILRKVIESNNLHSFILWGPPGVGKTTLAKIIANGQERPFFTLNAVTAGVKDVREIIEKAKKTQFFNSLAPILFIDEIHRFNKSQQDSLLNAIENGTFILIGATTENPSFEIITPLLSRCQIYVLKPLDKDDLLKLATKAISSDSELKKKNISIEENEALLRYSGGDARKLLNILEIICSDSSNDIKITNDLVTKRLQQNISEYDKNGEMHYDIVSAFIKSIRGSDPNAAIYWLARMIEGGEDPKFIARRLVISASEDIGLANPNALLIANACFDALQKIGWPEGRIILAEATIYLAASQKSNSAYLAINNAINIVKAPTKLMQELGYGKDYKYAHNYKNHFVKQDFLPEQIKEKTIWYPQGNPQEKKLSDWLDFLWNDNSRK